MKKLKATIAGVLVLASIMSVTACGEGAETAEVATTTTTTPEKTTNDTDKAVQEQVEAIKDTAADETLKVEKKIKWLAWWDVDETSAEVELFKSIYGIPEEGDESYGDDADHVFSNLYTAYATRYDELSKLVQSGDSPDVFPFEINNYPYSVYKGLFQSIDGVVDITTDEWANTKNSMDLFVWGGKNYCAIPSINTNSLLWYRRSVVEEAGLSDPYELYKAGNWNWDTFLEMCSQFSDPDTSKYCLDGFNPENEFVGTTGTPLISLDNGKLVSHLYDANIERAMDLLSTLCTQNYRYPRHELNGWNVNYSAWANGDTLFFCDGTWRFEEHWIRYRDKYGWADDEIFFVPMPKDPNADNYYQIMKQDAYMFVAGSQNEDGFKAWTKCIIACANDEDVKTVAREKKKKDYGWTDEQLDFLDELTHGAMTPIYDFKNGIGEDVASSSTQDNPIECLTKYVYVQGDQSYTQLRAENENIINTRVDLLNESVS